MFIKTGLQNFIFKYYLFVFILFFAFINVASAQTQKPNIILILVDDIGYKSLTCNGGNLYYTPNIDALSQQGMRFTQCYSAPNCSPSRFMLLTGKYNFRNYTQWGVMDRSEKTIGNMMKDAGYKTGFFGKDQLSGGGNKLNAWGFDEYCVHNAVGEGDGLLYKNPLLYTHGNYIPDSLTLNKYGPDIIADSLFTFIENNKSNPFFAYYPLNLVHEPWCPTPDDTVAFANWIITKPPNSDTSFFPSMMTYMDKEVGLIIKKLKSLGIENNTVLLFAGDNGTAGKVGDYVDEDTVITGKKSSTTSAGTHVPLIVYWPGTITEGTVNNDLIDFTDFLPTIAGIANIPIPTDYGTLDGVSFFSRLTGQPGTTRNWVFDYFDDHPGQSKPQRWAQTTQYKLYDTSAINSTRLFYDIINDPKEKNPIPNNLLSPEQTIIKQELLNAINGYIAQGIPLLKTPVIKSLTGSSATIIDFIRINGGSTITASGVVWDTVHNPVLSSGDYTSENNSWGEFYSYITGLNSNTTYYIRTYATNKAGTAYSTELSFTTPSLAPVAKNATHIKNTSIVANWNSLNNVNTYKLDVSLSPSFSIADLSSKTEDFDNGLTVPKGWAFSQKGLATNTIKFGKASPSIQFVKSKAKITTIKCPAPASSITFWVKGVGNHGSLLLEGFDGFAWKTIDNITDLPSNSITKTYDSGSSPALQNIFIRFRFSYIKSPGKGNISIDDIKINYDEVTPSFIPGYENLTVQGNSKLVQGLKKNTQYYYRARAVNNNGTSANSNIIKAITDNILLDAPACTPAGFMSDHGFTANWHKEKNADSYKVDVSTSPVFSVTAPVSLKTGFDNGITPPSGWTFSSGLKTDAVNFGKASPSIRFTRPNQFITTAIYPAPVTRLSFWVRGSKEDPGSMLVEGFDGSTWKTIESLSNITNIRMIKTYDSASPAFGNNFIQFRFTNTALTGDIRFDDVAINYSLDTPSYLPGYGDSAVTGNSLKITGLKNNTRYYYRVRGISISLDDTSENSNTVEAITCSKPVISNIAITNLTCNDDSSGSIDLTATGNGLAYNWTGPGNFSSQGHYIHNLAAGLYSVAVTSNGACKVDTTVSVTEPLPLNATAGAPAINCTGGTTIITVNATGGTGNYHYSLSDGINTTGPRNDNHFIVAAGNYTVIVEDDNHCSFTGNINIEDGTISCGSITSIQNKKRNEAENSKYNQKNKQLSISIFPNPSISEFTLSIQSTGNETIQILITDVLGNKVYQFSGINNGKYVFGNGFAPGTYFVQVMQGDFIKTIKLIKSGRRQL